MKIIFYLGLLVFLLYEFLNNYFVMGYPGSQEMNSLELSHALSYFKIYFEIIMIPIIIFSGIHVFVHNRRLIPATLILISILLYGYFNFIFTAENKFRIPQQLILEPVNTNQVDSSMMVIGIELNGESKAYPVDYIRYHHRIIDTIGDKVVMVTYCGLCRTGRVYEPYIQGEYTTFRLVGINHHNAMFEDKQTKSWWSQETGKCIVGKLKGAKLKEAYCDNFTLKKWVEMKPKTKIMQPDPKFMKRYRELNDYSENTSVTPFLKNQGILTRNTFVIGISIGNDAVAYEWNYLLEKRIVTDKVGKIPFALVISNDNKSFVAFENPSNLSCILRNDTLFINNTPYNFAGINLISFKTQLKKISAYREYWFSWLYAHPSTTKYNN